MAKSKRTPNQRLYQKQRQRLRRIEREYQQKLGVTNIPSVVPQMRDKVTKRDIERLHKITPEKFREQVFKNVQQYVPEVDKPVKIYQYKPRKPLTERTQFKKSKVDKPKSDFWYKPRRKIADISSDEIVSDFNKEMEKLRSENPDYFNLKFNDSEEVQEDTKVDKPKSDFWYKSRRKIADKSTDEIVSDFNKEMEKLRSENPDYFILKVNDAEEVQEPIEPEYEPLPEPPHTNPFYDNETGLWIDLDTGEILDPETKEPLGDEDYPEYDDIVLSNVTSALDDATNVSAASVIYKALNEEITNVGREEVAKRLEDAGFYAVDLALEVGEDSHGEKIKSNAVELLTIIRGGALTANDQFRLNEGLQNDRQAWNAFFGSQSNNRSRSGRRKR